MAKEELKIGDKVSVILGDGFHPTGVISEIEGDEAIMVLDKPFPLRFIEFEYHTMFFKERTFIDRVKTHSYNYHKEK